MTNKVGFKIDSNILVYSFGIYIIYTLINVIANSISGLPIAIDQALTVAKVAMYFMMFLGVLFATLNFTLREIAYIVGLAILFIFNYLCYSNIPVRFSSYFNTFTFICLPLSLLVFKIHGDRILKALELIGFVSSVLYLAMLVGMVSGRLHMNTYETSVGYAAILPQIAIINGIKQKEKLRRILSVIALVPYLSFVLMFGSRGPLLVFFLYIVYEFIYFEYRAGATKKIIIALVALILATILLLNTGDIINYILKLTGSRGINSRTLMLLSSDVTHSSGRDEIYQMVLRKIAEHPFSVRGIASDTEIIMGNQYVHNIFLELLYQFGVIFGGIACISIIWMWGRSLSFRTFENDPFETICAIVSIMQLMFSSSLWLNFVFWVWFARRIRMKNYD